MDVCVLLTVGLVWTMGRVGGWASPPRDMLTHGDILEKEMLTFLELEEQRLQNIRQLADVIRGQLKTVADQTEEVRANEKVVRSIHSPANSSTDSYLAHPLNALHTIRAWKDLRDAVKSDQRKNFNALCKSLIGQGVRLPDRQHAGAAYRNLLILQRVHDIRVSDLIQGTVLDTQAQTQMDSDIMLDIADTARELGEVWLAGDWTAHALFHANYATDPRFDMKVDYLMSSIQRLIQEQMIPKTASLELERWIYVYDRDVSRLKDVAEEILADIAWIPDKSTASRPMERFLPCRNTTSTLKDVFVMSDVCTEDNLQNLKTLGKTLNRMSFGREGMTTRVRPSLLSRDQMEVVETTLASVQNSVAKVCQECSQIIQTATEDFAYSFKVLYDSAAATGYQYTIEEDDFDPLKQSSNLVNVILLVSECTAGDIMPFPESQTLVVKKNAAYMWTSKYSTRAKDITYCPVLFGERWAVQITFAELVHD